MIKICEGISPDFNINVKIDKFIYVAPNKVRAAEIAKGFSTKRHKMRAVKGNLFFYDIVAGRNSVTYEEGFFGLCRHHFDLIKEAGYTLFWESPTNMIQSFEIKRDDEIDMFLLKKAYLNDNSDLVWVYNPERYRMGRWEKEVTYGMENCLFLKNHKMYNLFIPQMLTCFKQVEIFTPCFDYSSLKIILDYYKLDYQKIKCRCVRPKICLCFVKDIERADIVMPPLTASFSEMDRYISKMKGFDLNDKNKARLECLSYFCSKCIGFKEHYMWVYANEEVQELLKDWINYKS